MRFAFKELPAAGGDVARPVVGIQLEVAPGLSLPSLVDSGALHNRFGAWVARAVGIDLDGVESAPIAVGGFTCAAATVPVGLRLGDMTWEAPVAFCDPWPLDFCLLGQEGFFRWFAVTIRAAEGYLECEPEG